MKIQSFSDVITNSSSEIFCVASNKNLLRNFLQGVLELVLDKNANIDDYIEIQTGVGLELLKELSFDPYGENKWFAEFLEDNGLNIAYFRNSVEFSDVNNLLPIQIYLKETTNLTYAVFCDLLDEIYYDQTEKPLVFDYFFVPKANTNKDVVQKLNLMLHNFGANLYDITEKYC